MFWSILPRVVAALIGGYFLIQGAYLTLALTLSAMWGEKVLRTVPVLAWLLGAGATGLVYAVQPFPYGFPILLTVSVPPWVLGARRQWQMYEGDRDYRRTIGNLVDDYLTSGWRTAAARLSNLRDRRACRLAWSALLQRSSEASDDHALERIVTAFGLVRVSPGARPTFLSHDWFGDTLGWGAEVRRSVLKYLTDLVEETREDGLRRGVCRAARTSLESMRRHAPGAGGGALPMDS